MNNSLVSIIIPVYNTAEYLPQCLDSLLNQTYPHLEIVCVDDGSTDNVWAVLQEYAVKDSRVKVFHQENAGVSVARNLGLEHATGEFLMFVDSDDWLDLDGIDCCVRYFDEDTSMVIFDMYEDRTDYDAREKYRFEGRNGKKMQLDEMYILQSMHSVTNKIYRRCVFDLYKLRFPNGLVYAEDCVVGLCSYAGLRENTNSIYITNIPIYHYRKRCGSAMWALSQETLLGIHQLYAMDYVYRFMQQYGSLPAFRKVYPILFLYYTCKAFTNTPAKMHEDVRLEVLRMAKEQGLSMLGYMERRLRPQSWLGKLFHWFRGNNECFGLLGKSVWTITCQPTEKQYRFMGRLVYSRRYDILK